jgi:catechol 2,3-dioxygenase-like lactoylglutathione lyase family enzyme
MTYKNVFSGFSVTDLKKAQAFYTDILGLQVTDNKGMGLELHLPQGGSVFIYEKHTHVPATFTILNFEVEHIDAAVDELKQKGIAFLHYDNLPALQDEKEILRGKETGYGPNIAWVTDPAGNILSLLEN